MKKILMILLAIFLLSGCTTIIEEDKIEYIKITAEEAKEIMDTEEVQS